MYRGGDSMEGVWGEGSLNILSVEEGLKSLPSEEPCQKACNIFKAISTTQTVPNSLNRNIITFMTVPFVFLRNTRLDGGSRTFVIDTRSVCSLCFNTMSSLCVGS